MARRKTYGESMAEWEHEKDRKHWNQSFQKALDTKDYPRIKELIIEGLDEDFSFPKIDDPIVLNLINTYQKS